MVTQTNIKYENSTNKIETKASIKLFINLVWIGAVVTIIGFFVSASRSLRESLG